MLNHQPVSSPSGAGFLGVSILLMTNKNQSKYDYRRIIHCRAMARLRQTQQRCLRIAFLRRKGTSKRYCQGTRTQTKSITNYENQKTKQASQNRQARGECVHRILEHHRWRHTASCHNHITLPMKLSDDQIFVICVAVSVITTIIGICHGLYRMHF